MSTFSKSLKMSNQAKIIAARALAPSIYGAARKVWRVSRLSVNTVRALGMGCGGLPDCVITLENYGLGDNLLCTAVLHELRKRGRRRVWMMSDYGQLFAGGEGADRIVPASNNYKNFMKVWRRNVPKLEYAPSGASDRDIPPRRHIIAELCARAGITGSIAIRPYLKLTDAERAQEDWARERIVIQSGVSGAKYPMQNKQWDPKRFQQVVDTLHNDFDIIQLGSRVDPALQHVKDLRGLTSIRQSAAILSNARLYIGGVGFLMHLARAVECPGVIVYGGREAPWQSGYISNVNLFTKLPCSPCWRWNTCDLDRKCMRDIEPDDVVLAAKKLGSKPNAPLPVESISIE